MDRCDLEPSARVFPRQRRLCELERMERMNLHQFGPKNSQWRGGRSIASNGYVLVRVGKRHHLADVRGYAYEHRLVAEQKLGHRLRRGEQVHHADGNKTNNNPTNIKVVLDRAHHAVHHRLSASRRRLPGQDHSTVSCACGCGAALDRFDRWGRPRRFVSGHNLRVQS